MDGASNNLTLVELLAQGVTLPKADDLLSAEREYEQILLEQPNHAEANHNIAILLTLKGKLDAALAHLKICLNTNPNVNLFWASYIDVLVKLERISDAEELLISAKKNGLWHPSMQKMEEHIASLNLDPSQNYFLKLEELIASDEINTATALCSD